MLKPYTAEIRGDNPLHHSEDSTRAVVIPRHGSFPHWEYYGSFFLLARMPLTISANDFSNMAAV